MITLDIISILLISFSFDLQQISQLIEKNLREKNRINIPIIYLDSSMYRLFSLILSLSCTILLLVSVIMIWRNYWFLSLLFSFIIGIFLLPWPIKRNSDLLVPMQILLFIILTLYVFWIKLVFPISILAAFIISIFLYWLWTVLVMRWEKKTVQLWEEICSGTLMSGADTVVWIKKNYVIQEIKAKFPEIGEYSIEKLLKKNYLE